MEKVKGFCKKFWQDESGQGAIEYVFLALVIVALAVTFKDSIKTAVSAKIDELSSSIQGFSAE